MRRPSLPITATALIAAIALAACSDTTGTAEAERDTEVSARIENGDASPAGSLALKLPGGIEANINLPDGIGDDSKFDINGVGLFPGAKVRSIDIDAANARATKTATVKIGFSAPGDAAAVTDWYQQQFDAKSLAVSRRGETLSGTTKDGNPFTLALESAGQGASKGLLTITDTNSR